MRNSARLALPNTAIRVLSAYLERLDLQEFARSLRMIAWPTIANIKAVSGCSHASVIYARRDLVAAGMATKLRGSVHDQTGVYEFHAEPLQAIRSGAELHLRRRVLDESVERPAIIGPLLRAIGPRDDRHLVEGLVGAVRQIGRPILGTFAIAGGLAHGILVVSIERHPIGGADDLALARLGSHEDIGIGGLGRGRLDRITAGAGWGRRRCLRNGLRLLLH
jgi:hypothetical protein